MATSYQAELELARQHLRGGRFADAERICASILARQPGHPGATLELGRLLRNIGHHAAATEILERGVQVRPDDSDLRLELAETLKVTGRLAQAADQYQAILSRQPQLWGIHNKLGGVLHLMHDAAGAEAAFLRALELKPYAYQVLNNLGSLCAELGRRDAAAAYFRRAIAAHPGDYDVAYRNLAAVRKFHAYDDEMRAMERLFEDPAADDRRRMELGFALGKAFEDLGEYSRAFDYWTAANQAQRALSNYSLRDHIAFENKIVKAVPRARLTTADADASRPAPLPVFIVGMPRSGTSLTEQILSRHSQVHGAGELSTIHDLAAGSVARFPDYLDALDDEHWRALGPHYLQHIARLGQNAAVVTDKQPSNFPYLGIIRKMLPGAKIIHCRRDPMAIGLSCFRNRFLTVALDYTCRLEDIGAYYRHYESTMRYWNEALPGWIHELRYEALVADPEAAVRSLLEFIGLPWEPGCLEFHVSDRLVATGSALQVREPIHSSAVDYWRNFEQELAPLSRALRGEAAAGE